MRKVLAALSFLAASSAASAQQWVEYRPLNGAYRIEFPGQPTEAKDSSPSNGSPILTAECDPNPNVRFTVVMSEPAEDFKSRTIDERLDKERYTSVMLTGGKLRNEQSLTVGDVKARRLTIDLPGSETMRVQVLYTDSRFYWIQRAAKAGHDDEAEANRFFDSFRLLDK